MPEPTHDTPRPDDRSEQPVDTTPVEGAAGEEAVDDEQADAPSSQQQHMGQFRARPASVSDKPRRVRAGRKLATDGWPERLGWAGRRWIEAIRPLVPDAIWNDGLDYAQRGQTRRLETHVGGAEADVQGRPYRPYTTELLLRPFPHEKWDEAVRELVRSSLHAARLLSGEIPEEIQEDILAPLGLDLFPTREGDIRCVCNCRETGAWCKHGVCVAMLLAEDFDEDPFLLFRLRGLEGEDLLEKLRQRRELESTGGSKPSSALRLPFPGDETPAMPLESCVDSFWDTPASLEEIETTPRRPEVAHALLRRLGPSPFEEGRFPLAGLLATCYDTFTRDALNEEPVNGDANEPAQEAPPERSGETRGPKLSAAARLLRAKVAGKSDAKAKAKAKRPGE